MEDEARAALERFVVDNQELEGLEARLAEFNIFEALGIVRQETRHSNLLAFLLDPSQNHGLGDALLKRLLKRVLVASRNPPLSVIEVDVADLRGAEVRREWQGVDILILDQHNTLVCAVENKIDAGEHSDQLKRYQRSVEREYPHWRAVLLYLTPEGEEPSAEVFIPVSYADVAALIDAVRLSLQPALGTVVSTLMDHYATMLRRHIVSSSDIAELCRQIYRKHQRALDLIFEHRPDLQSSLSLQLKQIVEEAGVQGFEMERFTKTYIDFACRDWDALPGQTSGHGWTPSGRILLFEFQNSSDFLRLKLIIGPGP